MCWLRNGSEFVDVQRKLINSINVLALWPSLFIFIVLVGIFRNQKWPQMGLIIHENKVWTDQIWAQIYAKHDGDTPGARFGHQTAQNDIILDYKKIIKYIFLLMAKGQLRKGSSANLMNSQELPLGEALGAERPLSQTGQILGRNQIRRPSVGVWEIIWVWI